ncbi:MAG: hypothetical protein PHU07_10510 [Acidocella sp.]|nr:hypothetical protein [Acidocella sp.]
MNDNLAKDFVALWQSELTAMAADRELRETWTATLGLWAQAANAALANLPHDYAPGSPGPAQPARATPAAAASEPRLDEVVQLERRVAELEQRLAEFLAREQDGTAPPAAGI